jgi:hypothetical protein
MRESSAHCVHASQEELIIIPTGRWVTCDVIRSVFGNVPENGVAKRLKVPMERFFSTPHYPLEYILGNGEV